jgi:hypothetical protein
MGKIGGKAVVSLARGPRRRGPFLGPEPKIRVGRVLGAPVEMLLIIILGTPVRPVFESRAQNPHWTRFRSVGGDALKNQ